MDTNIEEIDLRGLRCPEPVLRAKKMFDNSDCQFARLRVDDMICVNNLQRLATSLKLQFHAQEQEGNFTVTLQRSDASAPSPVQQAASAGEELQRHNGTVVFLTRDRFGEGDEEFSLMLMNVFLQTLFESGHRPETILMANTGVRLMARSASTRKVLDDLAGAGVAVLACGLCVDYYRLKDDVPLEQITNMFTICEYLFAADRIIQP